MSIAFLLAEVVGIKKARGIWDRIAQVDLIKYESQVVDDISDFIGRAESQRKTVLRKLRDETTTVAFLVLAIIGCVRAKETLELRDRYRDLLAPGRGNRATVAGMYEFAMETLALIRWEWPDAVFDAIGIDSEDEFDRDLDERANGDPAQIAEAGQLEALKPLPPPPPPPPRERRTEIVVHIAKSKVLETDGENPSAAWRWQFSNRESGLTGLIVSSEKPKQERVFHVMSEFLERYDASGLANYPGVLVFTDSLKDCLELARLAGKGESVAPALKGVAQRSFMKQPEQWLESLQRELSLVGVPLPGADSLMECLSAGKKGVISVYDGEPEWEARARDRMEAHVKRILAQKGRWIGDVNVSRDGRGNTEGKDLALLKREINKLAQSNLTSRGEAFLGAVTAVMEWRSGELSTAEARSEIARHILREQFNERIVHGWRNTVRSDCEEFIGYGTAEMDLIESALIEALGKPFGGPQAGTNWHMAWWIEIDVDATKSGVGLNGLPRHGSIAKQCVKALGIGGLQLVIHPELKTVSVSGVRDIAWSRRSSNLWKLEELVHQIRVGSRSPLDKKYWASQTEEVATCRALLIASTPNLDDFPLVASRWGTAAIEMEAMLRESLAGQPGGARTSIKVRSELCRFVDPVVTNDSRLALMAGMGWDATHGHCIGGSIG